VVPRWQSIAGAARRSGANRCRQYLRFGSGYATARLIPRCLDESSARSRAFRRTCSQRTAHFPGHIATQYNLLRRLDDQLGDRDARELSTTHCGGGRLRCKQRPRSSHRLRRGRQDRLSIIAGLTLCSPPALSFSSV